MEQSPWEANRFSADYSWQWPWRWSENVEDVLGIFLSDTRSYKFCFDEGFFFVNDWAERACEQMMRVMYESKTEPVILVLAKFSNEDLYNFNSHQISEYRRWDRDSATGFKVRIWTPGRNKRILWPPVAPDRLWGPPSYLFNGFRFSFLKINLPEREI